MGDDLSYGLNTLGPLCLWQCFFFVLAKSQIVYLSINVEINTNCAFAK